jgi:hypothetical protein
MDDSAAAHVRLMCADPDALGAGRAIDCGRRCGIAILTVAPGTVLVLSGNVSAGRAVTGSKNNGDYENRRAGHRWKPVPSGNPSLWFKRNHLLKLPQ